MKIGISSCLVGIDCTYSGSNNLVRGLQKLYKEGKAVIACPEVLGGLSIPRDPAEIQSQNPLTITTIHNRDVTYEYQQGAQKALDIFIENDVSVAILKWRSPSCGNDGVYDGSFSHHLIDGQGVFAQMLAEHGIKVFNEKQISEFLAYIGENDEYKSYFQD